ncbi:putative Zn-dependent protease [Candidatus Methanoperedens nitroreducens]|uniref:Archaemetzincin n=1 Tax=Candidatus Methanoperedens nitratireducens TaxID=1392998 RepID=A0A062V6T2_9EURY|nr:archaemetzincin family Zn-dependent metalloprotease [Candidatus Methanoperedens nitroreducens]KCZ73002.1 putative Zn-dependent protease [Candidatus Methanoperedens nitroreducens]MDJ1423054.1 archaemetzincin family Zn-dependent metalloprotease [Candidatus Methanoperedens sp.]
MGYIYLQPIGEVGEELLHYICTRLEGIYGHPCRTALSIGVPEGQYNANREQYYAAGIVEEIAVRMPLDAEKLLGVADVDLYVHGVNFVFGVAIGNAAIISLTRLRPEYYGRNRNKSLFRERTLKEAVHELGHTFGLGHCPEITCVMHFSNNIEDTDIKGIDLCRNCSVKIGKN